MVSLQLQDISKAFASAVALQNVHWKLEDGQLGIILGPSGSGKTTLLKIIAGLLLPDSGDVLFNENSVLNLTASERNIGYVPQSLALFPHLTVEKNLAFGLEARHWKKADIRERTEELLRLGEIEDLAMRYPREISGGQQQRVALLRALAPRPQILLLDEPLGALDLELRARMLRAIKTIQRSTKTTAVLVSHNPQETILEADNVLVIDKGKVVQTGMPPKVLHSPAIVASAIIGVKNVFKAIIRSSDKENLLLDTPLGPIRLPAPVKDNIKDLKGIQIPPSKISVSMGDQPVSGSLTVEGKVSHATYLGDQTEVAIEIPDSDLMLFIILNSHDAAPKNLETGQNLKCSFLLSDIKLL
ncbi:MAG: ABC transporter ATP-binding protein [Candidatus Thorarchaeota archaeon]